METRVGKFKKYRESLMEIEDTSQSSHSVSRSRQRMRTTLNDASNVLPMDQVMQKLCIDREEIKKVKRAKIKKYLVPILIGVGIAIVLTVLVIVGINVFKS